ncbi:MAG: hypothetical protein ABL963_05105 [Longimicrobiales bacterium]
MRRAGNRLDIVLGLACVAVTGLALASWNRPYLWVSAAWFCFLLLRTARSPTKKFVWFNLAFAVALFGGLEAYMWIPGDMREVYATGTTTPDEVVGYAPLSGPSRHEKYFEDVTVFDVTYHVGENGLRITPPGPGDGACILFFGDSFTYGDGVRDDEALPYQVGMIVKDRFATFNFGYRGYGPHQMLASLQQGRVARIIGACQPGLIIYSAIGDHLNRVAGRTSWDAHGPKYQLVGDELEYAGHFDDRPTRTRVEREIRKSLLFDRVWSEFEDPDTEEDAALFGRVVSESARLIGERYPGSEFHVLFWDRFDNAAEIGALAALDREGITTHRVSEIIPNYDVERAKYEISVYDNHPSPLAYRLVSEFVVEELIEP